MLHGVKHSSLYIYQCGLGLRSLSHHASAAFIASYSSSGWCNNEDAHLNRAIDTCMFNEQVALTEKISLSSITSVPCSQKGLSLKLDSFQFQQLMEKSSPADKARLYSVSAKHAASWLSVAPSIGLGFHLDPEEFHIAVKLDISYGSQCALCPVSSLDSLGHHATTCKRGGDAIFRHNNLRDVLAGSFHTAHLSVQVEAGAGLSTDLSQSRPADILVQDWDRGKPAAFDFDISVDSPLNSNVLPAAGARAGAASEAAELRKHTANDAKCAELGWVSIPLVVESYGAWGKEAQQSFSKLASRLAVHGCVPKSMATFELYARLNISLMRANSRAMLSRS